MHACTHTHKQHWLLPSSTQHSVFAYEIDGFYFEINVIIFGSRITVWQVLERSNSVKLLKK